MHTIKSLEQQADKAKDIGDAYVKHSLVYYKLKTLQSVTRIVATITKILLFGSLIILAFAFICVAGAIVFSKFWDSDVLGFLTMVVIILFMGIILYPFRKKIDDMVLRKISKNF